MQSTQHTEERAGDALEGFHVRINGVSLVDLLQMFHMSRRSVTLRLSEGQLHIRDGEVIHAEYGEVTGELAVRKMLELRGGELETDSLGSTPVSVRRPLTSVLLDALVSLDEGADAQECNDSVDPELEQSQCDTSQTRVAQLDAICGSINQNVEGALFCAIVDLERGLLLGCDERRELPGAGHEMLLDTTLSLFRRGPLPALEALLGEDSASDESKTRELCIVHGEHLYLGRRLNENSAILVVATPTSAPTVHLAQLRNALSRGTPA